MIQLVLFDIDGTLIRTGGAGVAAFERTFASEFRIRNATEKLGFAGRTDWSLVRECFAIHQIKATTANFRRFFENYVFWLDHLLTQRNGGVCPNVREFIQSARGLSKPPLLGLLTGNIRLGAEIKLRHYELWESFRTGAFGDDHEERNELAVIALERAQRLLGEKIRGDEILVIGDTPLDIECAKTIRGKMLAVATGGYSREALQAFAPTWAVDNLSQISPAEIWG